MINDKLQNINTRGRIFNKNQKLEKYIIYINILMKPLAKNGLDHIHRFIK